MATNLKLMADYECFPLWGMDIGQIGEIHPDWLPISAELKRQLAKWGENYTATLNRKDPQASGFESAEAKSAFEREGLRLWHDLRMELGRDFNVFYLSALTGQEMSPHDHPL